MAVTNPGGTVAYSPQAAGPPLPPLVPTHSGSRTVSIPGVPSVVVSVSSKPINVHADAAEGRRPIRMVGPVICLAAGFFYIHLPACSHPARYLVGLSYYHCNHYQ